MGYAILLIAHYQLPTTIDSFYSGLTHIFRKLTM